jgi:hypothetical protein
LKFPGGSVKVLKVGARCQCAKKLFRGSNNKKADKSYLDVQIWESDFPAARKEELNRTNVYGASAVSVRTPGLVDPDVHRCADETWTIVGLERTRMKCDYATYRKGFAPRRSRYTAIRISMRALWLFGVSAIQRPL